MTNDQYSVILSEPHPERNAVKSKERRAKNLYLDVGAMQIVVVIPRLAASE